MKQTSGLLPALGRSLTGAMPEAGDSELSLPNILLPSLEACFPQQWQTNPGAGSSNNTEFTESFAAFLTIDRAIAGGSQTTRLGLLREGYWEWTLFSMMGIPAALDGMTIYYNFMSYPDLTGLQTNAVFSEIGSGAIRVIQDQRVFRFLIPRGFVYRIETNVNNTSGATAYIGRVFMQFRRLA